MVDKFLRNVSIRRERVSKIFKDFAGLITIWGMSGKGVIFSNLLTKGIQRRIPFTLDDDKGKQGKYSPGIGYLILPHIILKEKPVENILVMNPNYYQEMKEKLRKLGVKSRLIRV